MGDREKVIGDLEGLTWDDWYEWHSDSEVRLIAKYAIELLKEQENEYENGFNDAMLGKRELMYEGTDGKWHKNDW